MTWSASIASVTQTPAGEAVAVVNYTDGSATITEKYVVITKELLNKVIASKAAQLEAASTAALDIKPGAVDVAVVEEPPETPVIDQQKIDFQAAYRKVLAFQKAIELGITTDQDATYKAALQAAKANYSGAYIGSP